MKCRSPGGEAGSSVLTMNTVRVAANTRLTHHRDLPATPSSSLVFLGKEKEEKCLFNNVEKHICSSLFQEHKRILVVLGLELFMAHGADVQDCISQGARNSLETRGSSESPSVPPGRKCRVLSVGVSVENVPLRSEIFRHLPPSGIIWSACDAVGVRSPPRQGLTDLVSSLCWCALRRVCN